MKKYGGFIPGIRPGSKTAEFIERVLDRVTLVGALYLAGISILPEIMITQMNVPVLLRGHVAPDRGRAWPWTRSSRSSPTS